MFNIKFLFWRGEGEYRKVFASCTPLPPTGGAEGGTGKNIMYWSGGVFIFFASIVTWKSVHKLEIWSYLLYFIGVCFMFTDSFAMKTEMDRQSYLGDLVAFIGAGASAIFTYYNKKHKFDLHSMVSLTQMFILCWIHQFIFFPFLSNSNEKF